MSWFWGSSNSDDGKNAQDPLRSLDPALRDFLAKESPVKYSSSNPPSTSQSPAAPQPTQTAASEKIPSTSPSWPHEVIEKRPPPTLYPDGRYAHLWKTYKSPAEVEAAYKTDQERINDVLEGYKYRRAEIGRVALENCALEQSDVNECFRSGGWKSRMTMCRAENRKFERCYMMQSVCISMFAARRILDRLADVYRNS